MKAFTFTLTLFAGLLTLALAPRPEAAAQGKAEPRQKYGAWMQHAEKGYHYREYFFKPKASDKEYQHQYVVYYKNDAQKRNWVYFYSPKSEKFWARYPTALNEKYKDQVKAGKELWSVLPADKRKKDLGEIDNAAFGAVGNECPTIPESTDKVAIEVPPSDLP